MANVALLRERINESGIKMSVLAERCGLTYQGLWRKLRGETEFRVPEMQAIKDTLHLETDEVMDIFFS